MYHVRTLALPCSTGNRGLALRILNTVILGVHLRFREDTVSGLELAPAPPLIRKSCLTLLLRTLSALQMVHLWVVSLKSYAVAMK